MSIITLSIRSSSTFFSILSWRFCLYAFSCSNREMYLSLSDSASFSSSSSFGREFPCSSSCFPKGVQDTYEETQASGINYKSKTTQATKLSRERNTGNVQSKRDDSKHHLAKPTLLVQEEGRQVSYIITRRDCNNPKQGHKQPGTPEHEFMNPQEIWWSGRVASTSCKIAEHHASMEN